MSDWDDDGVPVIGYWEDERPSWENVYARDAAIRNGTLDEYLDDRWSRAAPRRYAGARLEHVDSPARERLTEWVESGDHRNVLLTGPVGVGKTYAAFAALRARYDRGETVRHRSVALLLDDLRPGTDLNIAKVIEPKVLLLDDYGMEKSSEWGREKIAVIAEERLSRCRPTIITSNLTPSALRDRIDERIYSRLFHGARAFALGGPDRRKG